MQGWTVEGKQVEQIPIYFTRKEWEDIALSIGYDLEVNGQTMSFDLQADLSNIKDRIEKNLGIE